MISLTDPYSRLDSMTDAMDEQKLASIRRQIRLLEWDINIIKDEELSKRKRLHLDRLRSELKALDSGRF
ncbi:hypothetical protein KY362_02855 [Candidatus Woesearchaeota archaeon]|nr:hypothetical protein [Candidatus Woesearchaeota archaeon]